MSEGVRYEVNAKFRIYKGGGSATVGRRKEEPSLEAAVQTADTLKRGKLSRKTALDFGISTDFTAEVAGDIRVLEVTTRIVWP